MKIYILAGSTVNKKKLNEISKHSSIVQTLLSARASPNIVHSNTGITPLHIASMLGSLGSVGDGNVTKRVALSSVQKINVNCSSFRQCGYTSLHIAALKSHSECLQMLIDNGGNLLAKTETGLTVIDFIFVKIRQPISFPSSCVIMDSRDHTIIKTA
ncbi:unnamed protein product [Heterotrigona itama]|uniref:Uncharacterized protein n=1 Tax=Heterotrigona itama TaxID=395501 RepID=A0A6V7HF38_9HYME|nr:unnamed protein product [Heterotrigona itama]